MHKVVIKIFLKIKKESEEKVQGIIKEKLREYEKVYYFYTKKAER